MQVLFREFVTTTVKDLLRKIGFDADVKTSELAREDGKILYSCEISLRDGQNLLIGQHGANMAALFHIVRLLVREEQPEGSLLSLDVNHYFEEKRSFLEREAKEAAKEVEETGLPVTLRPMLSFERKIVHTLFAEHPKVTTESVGQGEERKVLIKRRPESSPEELDLV